MTEAHARRTDPWTSHAAAQSIRKDEIRLSQQAILDCFSVCGEMHDDELLDNYALNHFKYNWPHQSPSGIRTRRSELVTMGKLKDSGRTVRKPSRRKAIVWELA